MVYVLHNVEQEKKLSFNGQTETSDGAIQKIYKDQLFWLTQAAWSLIMAKKKNQSVSKAWSKTKKK